MNILTSHDLPHDIDSIDRRYKKINANFDKGDLEIDQPKSIEVKPKKVNITTLKKEKAPNYKTISK